MAISIPPYETDELTELSATLDKAEVIELVLLRVKELQRRLKVEGQPGYAPEMFTIVRARLAELDRVTDLIASGRQALEYYRHQDARYTDDTQI